jgi:hypothetical protein
MLTFRDISHLEKLEKQQKELDIMDIVTSSVTHNMITPLKSMALLSRNLSQTLAGTTAGKDTELIYSTSQLLLSEVKLLLDRSQLEHDRFFATLDQHPIN